MSSDTDDAAPRRSWIAILPFALFMLLAGIFLLQLMSGRDAATVPSALIGAPAPERVLPPLEGVALPGLEPGMFEGRVTVVNVWASWCAPCRDEHPHLMALADDPRVTLAGINYKDRTENARRFLGELGNPFDRIGVDGSGRAAIDWGVYGVPETFVVGRDGRIAYKHVGPFDAASFRERLMPAIEAALAAD